MRSAARAMGASLAALSLALAASATVQALRLRSALRHGRGLVRQAGTAPTEAPRAGGQRLLLLGDSTGLGVGSDATCSLSALLARRFPQAVLVNACVSGAVIADVAGQLDRLPPQGPFDAVLLMVGGNDILRGHSMARMRGDVRALLPRLQRLGCPAAWLSNANIGLAPVFVPPFSWWLSARTRRAQRLFACEARAHGLEFLSFFYERRDDIFSREPQRYFAKDGVHPSAESYRHCVQVLLRHRGWRQRLGPPQALV